MKFLTKSFFLSLFILASWSANTQLSIGIRAGTNIATISYSPDDDLINPTSIAGLIIAVPLNIGISDKFSVQPEIQFVQKGFEISYDFGFSATGTQVINYIDVPILAIYSFVNSESIAVYVSAGPVFGYALNGKTTFESGGQKETEDIDWDNMGYNRFEVGLSFGAGAGFSVGPGQIIVDLRYVLGLSNLSDGSFEGEIIKNKGIGASLGYMIPLNGGE